MFAGYPPAVLIIAVLALTASALGVWSEVLGSFGGGSLLWNTASLFVSASVAFEVAMRWRRLTNDARQPTLLSSLVGSRRVTPENIGMHAARLLEAYRLGLPIVDAVVLDHDTGDRVAAAVGKAGRADWARLPRRVRGAVDALVFAYERVVFKPSFVRRPTEHSFAGIFPSVIATGRDRAALAQKLLEVFRSRERETTGAYRRRRNDATPLGRALLLQPELDCELSGAVRSRGRGGRMDQVLIDYTRPRSPTRSVEYDLIDDVARAAEQPSSIVATAWWMRQVAWFALRVEQAFDEPVILSFGVLRGRIIVTDLRRAHAQRRTSYWAIALDSESGARRPALLHDLRGGLDALRVGIRRCLKRFGVGGDVAEADVRYVDGESYADVRLWRRVAAEVADGILLRPSVRKYFRLFRRPPSFRLPVLPAFDDASPEGWQKMKQWHGRAVLPVVQAHVETLMLRSILRAAHRLVREQEDEGKSHPVLEWLLARRRRACEANIARMEGFLKEAEVAMSDYARATLARGVRAWDQVFSGDRHLHLNLQMIDTWIEGDEASRAALDAKWRERRSALSHREQRAVATRTHEPPLLETTTGGAQSIGIAPGRMAGRALVVGERRPSAPEGGAIVVLTGTDDGHVAHLLGASGAVLLGGGALSVVATVAEELGVPTVLSLDARTRKIASGQRLVIDGESGEVRVES